MKRDRCRPRGVESGLVKIEVDALRRAYESGEEKMLSTSELQTAVEFEKLDLESRMGALRVRWLEAFKSKT